MSNIAYGIIENGFCYVKNDDNITMFSVVANEVLGSNSETITIRNYNTIMIYNKNGSLISTTCV